MVVERSRLKGMADDVIDRDPNPTLASIVGQPWHEYKPYLIARVAGRQVLLADSPDTMRHSTVTKRQIDLSQQLMNIMIQMNSTMHVSTQEFLKFLGNELSSNGFSKSRVTGSLMAFIR
ncbi:hypothetical protein QC761_0060680 [Podospora bellae-mahoneyi]|uniref:Uncharacterized protein n=1 Tax=Podospora bellae-mahoneyi TaxID=2093777 RepID=A0ABR0FFJ1_9PEZI|nr:hypothetical protein QC761_0060680 [Podospora bellae-mahoneyi]